jgi:hypothetical protein
MAALIKIDHASTSASARADAVRFCSRCGEPAPTAAQDAPVHATRVCAACGMGLLLSCARQALPGAGAAFLIATADLSVTAVSQAAEVIFGHEGEVLGTPLSGLLTCPLGESRLASTITRAALRAREPEVLPVRGRTPGARRVGTMAARVSTCGRPRAALVTVEPSVFGRH